MAGKKLMMTSMIAMLCVAGAAHADDAAARGEQVVEQWCRTCHLRATDAADPDMGPPYEEIVRRPGRDEAYFVRFMQEDHFPMTIFRLFDHEKADVVAYLMALQRRGSSRP
jgi:mono/diheme cytochrome c family protein